MNCPDSFSLSDQQRHVLQLIACRKSVFFTGPAGCGKSHLLRTLRRVLSNPELGIQSGSYYFVAPTGVAACNIQGMTINAWAGLSLTNKPQEQMLAEISRNQDAVRRWKSTEILIIDEISMLSAELFDFLSFMGRRIRGVMKPFGGIQLVICGDFFQLPPVGLNGSTIRFCFESDTWIELFNEGMKNVNKVASSWKDAPLITGSASSGCGHVNADQDIRRGSTSVNIVVLDQVNYRQTDDRFLKVLNEIRCGQLSEETCLTLREKVRDKVPNLAFNITENEDSVMNAYASIMPVKLFSLNKDVGAYNSKQLQEICGYNGREEVKMVKYTALDDGIDGYKRQLNDSLKAPQVLELCIGAQVMLLKNIDTSRCLVNGAIGIIKDFVKKRDIQPTTVATIPTIFHEYPLVEFVDNVKKTKMSYVITEESWEITAGEHVVAWRTQVPLALAWGISIHKSQGLQFAELHISLKGVFDYGQCYVALSRAECLEGLTLDSFHSSAVRVHDRVKRFYENLHCTMKDINTFQSSTVPPDFSTSAKDKTCSNDSILVFMKDLVVSFKTGKVGVKLADNREADSEWLVSNSKEIEYDDGREVDEEHCVGQYDEWLDYVSPATRCHHNNRTSKKRGNDDHEVRELTPAVRGAEGTAEHVASVSKSDTKENYMTQKSLFPAKRIADDDEDNYDKEIEGAIVARSKTYDLTKNPPVEDTKKSNRCAPGLCAWSETAHFSVLLGSRKDVEKKKRQAQAALLRCSTNSNVGDLPNVWSERGEQRCFKLRNHQQVGRTPTSCENLGEKISGRDEHAFSRDVSKDERGHLQNLLSEVGTAEKSPEFYPHDASKTLMKTCFDIDI